MKQIVQQYKTGKIQLVDVPYPYCMPNNLIVKNYNSVISIGTERSVIELGRKSLAGKARSRPDLVKRFIEKSRNEGLYRTYKSAMRRLNEAKPLGYSCAGEVVETGDLIKEFSPGDKVACIGAGYACHSEYVSVSQNLCVRIPDGVNFDQAAYGMLGIISMHAMRCAKLKPGEHVAVVGLGLLGLILIQLLDAYGYQVIATDMDKKKCDLAKKLNIGKILYQTDEFLKTCNNLTGGFGVDSVILAVATKSDKPIHDAIRAVKFGGRIVLMGVADVHPHRNEMWEKEVEVIVSKSGGPGVEDPIYEHNSIDYPQEYVRWTEKRNLHEFLRLLHIKKVQTDILTTHKSDFNEVIKIYEELLNKKDKDLIIGVVLKYPIDTSVKDTYEAIGEKNQVKNGKCNLGVIGGGLFATTTILPILSKLKQINLNYLCTSKGITSNHIGKTIGFNKYTTDYLKIINDQKINTVFILTRHNMHTNMVMDALQSNKHIFVEKPLCTNHKELDDIIDQYEKMPHKPLLMVGYNRRFAPLSKKLKAFFLDRNKPMIVHYRVNAGYLSPDHWVNDYENGNGRIISEVCHMVDYLMYLTQSRPLRVSAERTGASTKDFVNNDNSIINIKFADGSIGSITYSSSGDRSLNREQVEVFCDEKAAIMTDFRVLNLYKNGKKEKHKLSNQNMGYHEELVHFFDIINGHAKPLLTPNEIFYSTRTVFSVHDSINQCKSIEIKI